MIPNKIVSFFLGLVLTIGSLYLGILSWNAYKSHDYIGRGNEQEHAITITGEGRVVGVPDIARVQLGYTTEKKTVAEAQKENTERMNAVIKKLKEDFKIDQKDIQTTDYNIYPQYDYSNNGKQTLRGYQVSQNISIKVRNLEKVSQILDVAGQLDLNQVYGLTFEIDNQEKLKAEARELALKQAKEKAEALSNIVGIKLGKIISFSESSDIPTPIMGAYERMADGMGGGGSPAVEPGSHEIRIIATVEYETF